MAPPAPLVSLIVLAGSHQAESVTGLLGPELPDAEIVAVGDGPAFADPRVRRLADADADAALDAAAGDYVWFLEAGARLDPGTLIAVAERLVATAPDVLVLERSPAGLSRRLLRRVAGDVTATLDKRP